MDRNKLEKLITISNCVSAFSEGTGGDSIDNLLSVVGRFYDADRAYIFENSSDQKHINITHSWSANGSTSDMKDLKELSIDLVQVWYEAFKASGAFFMNILSTNTAGSEETRKLLAEHGVDSLMAAPITQGDTILGFFGIDNPGSATDDISLLKIGANLSGSEIIRRGQLKQLKEAEESHSIIEGFINNFDIVCKVDLTTGALTFLRSESPVMRKNLDCQFYSQFVELLLHETIIEQDKDLMRRELNTGRIRQRISAEQTYSVEHRVLKNGVSLWGEMTVYGLDQNQIIIGFKLKNQEIILHHLQEMSNGEYYALFSIDLDLEQITLLKKNEWFNAGEVGDSAPLSALMKAFASTLEGDQKKFFLRLSDIKTIQQDFRVENKLSFSYEAPADKTWLTVTAFVVLRHDDGTPAIMTLGFSKLDSLGAERLALLAKIAEQQEQLQAALRVAQDANVAKTVFLSNMSHDIRTPMNAIMGFTDIAQKHFEDQARVKDCLNKIETSGAHLLNLINEVLEMSRVEAGKIKSDMKVVVVEDASQKLITICHETASARNITLTFNNTGIHHTTVLADELHINQVLMNVLGNAIKYTMPGGSVNLTIGELESDNPEFGRYRFIVEDTGIGMSKEFLARIFESFSREETQTVSGIQGTGLGMSIVKRLVDYMGGTIDIESEQGKGTKVTIIMTLQYVEEATDEGAAAESTEVDLSGKRVLLVEDNELNREIATVILEDMGIEVDAAVNGLEAVEGIKAKGFEYYDCVLMDIQMPIMDGYEATSKIREMEELNNKTKGIQLRRLPIIALSANAFEEDKQKSHSLGMDDHIAKPIDMKQLKDALVRFIK